MPQKSREVYGLPFPMEWNPLMVELSCYRHDHRPERGGLGRFGHLVNIVDWLWGRDELGPKRWVWHEWAVALLQELCAYPRCLTVAGPSSAGKTDPLAVFSIIEFLAAPMETLVLMLSRTVSSAARNIWGRTVERWNQVGGLPGKVVPSLHRIRALEPYHQLETVGIQCIATEQSSDKDKLGKFLGVKQERIMVVVDELSEINQNVPDACFANLTSNPGFRFAGSANPNSIFDPHGQLCEPETGWGDFDPEATVYKTKRGVCVRFDGEKTPNHKYKDTLKITQVAYVEEMRRTWGENSPKYNRFVRALWGDNSEGQTLYSQKMLTRFKAMELVVWARDNLIPLCGFDPAFTKGGDRAIAVFPRVGDSLDGLTTFDFQGLDGVVEFKLTSDTDPNHQLAEMLVAECRRRKVRPEHCGIDVTGGGRVLAEIVEREWGAAVHKVSFGGMASELPVSERDRRPSHEAYVNRVTELWFNGMEYLQANQLRHLSPEICLELSQRRYETRGSRDVVEPKSEMKARTGKSPDVADGFVISLNVVREVLGIYPHGLAVVEKEAGTEAWGKLCRGSNSNAHRRY